MPVDLRAGVVGGRRDLALEIDEVQRAGLGVFQKRLVNRCSAGADLPHQLRISLQEVCQGDDVVEGVGIAVPFTNHLVDPPALRGPGLCDHELGTGEQQSPVLLCRRHLLFE